MLSQLGRSAALFAALVGSPALAAEDPVQNDKGQPTPSAVQIPTPQSARTPVIAKPGETPSPTWSASRNRKTNDRSRLLRSSSTGQAGGVAIVGQSKRSRSRCKPATSGRGKSV